MVTERINSNNLSIHWLFIKRQQEVKISTYPVKYSHNLLIELAPNVFQMLMIDNPLLPLVRTELQFVQYEKPVKPRTSLSIWV